MTNFSFHVYKLFLISPSFAFSKFNFLCWLKMSRAGSSSFHLPQNNSSNVLHHESNRRSELCMQCLSYKDRPLRCIMQLRENSGNWKYLTWSRIWKLRAFKIVCATVQFCPFHLSRLTSTIFISVCVPLKANIASAFQFSGILDLTFKILVGTKNEYLKLEIWFLFQQGL
jgi:hypothetical protein